MYISSAAEQLISTYQTRNPFELAKELGITILYETLGGVRGYYSASFGVKFIHINNCLPEYLRNFVCAHELGHAVLHTESNTPYLRANTLLLINRYEIEANKFAACLLLPDETLRDCADYHYTVPQIAALTGLPESLVKYRISQF